MPTHSYAAGRFGVLRLVAAFGVLSRSAAERPKILKRRRIAALQKENLRWFASEVVHQVLLATNP
jgi:hypothetical protein